HEWTDKIEVRYLGPAGEGARLRIRESGSAGSIPKGKRVGVGGTVAPLLAGVGDGEIADGDGGVVAEAKAVGDVACGVGWNRTQGAVAVARVAEAVEAAGAVAATGDAIGGDVGRREGLGRIPAEEREIIAPLDGLAFVLQRVEILVVGPAADREVRRGEDFNGAVEQEPVRPGQSRSEGRQRHRGERAGV